jgi:hypothetical protein
MLEWRDRPYGIISWKLPAENWFFRHPMCTKNLEVSGIGVTHKKGGSDLLTNSIFRMFQSIKLSR